MILEGVTLRRIMLCRSCLSLMDLLGLKTIRNDIDNEVDLSGND